MLVDLLDKLIDRAIQLIRHREEVDRHLYNEFVTPAFNELDTIHADYLRTFRKYREIVKTSPQPMDEKHPLLDQIKEDGLYSLGQRRRARALAEAAGNPKLDGFVTAVREYLYTGERGLDDIARNQKASPKARRITPTTGKLALRKIRAVADSRADDSEKRQRAITILDEIIETIQDRYTIVTKEYQMLKRQLTRPK